MHCWLPSVPLSERMSFCVQLLCVEQGFLNCEAYSREGYKGGLRPRCQDPIFGPSCIIVCENQCFE